MRRNVIKVISVCMVMLIAGMAAGELYHSSEKQMCSCCKKACEHCTKVCVCNHSTIQYAMPETCLFLKLAFNGLLSPKEDYLKRDLFVCDIFHPPKYLS